MRGGRRAIFSKMMTIETASLATPVRRSELKTEDRRNAPLREIARRDVEDGSPGCGRGGVTFKPFHSEARARFHFAEHEARQHRKAVLSFREAGGANHLVRIRVFF